MPATEIDVLRGIAFIEQSTLSVDSEFVFLGSLHSAFRVSRILMSFSSSSLEVG